MKVLAALALLLLGPGASATDRVTLSGDWEVRLDPTEKWIPFKVPGCFNYLSPEALRYQGKAWYRTRFTIPHDWSAEGPLYLRFLGVAIRAKVWVNGDLVGEHLFPHTAFEVDITRAAVRDGSNGLVVMADNALEDMAIPDKKCVGWWNYGGIHREVYLEHRPGLFLEDPIVVTKKSGDRWTLALTLRVRNHGETTRGAVVVQLRDKRGRLVWNTRIHRRFPAGLSEADAAAAIPGVRPWSPESPNLYSLRLETSSGATRQDHKEVRIGFRQIEVRGTEIHLNGRRILVKGISRHEMYPGVGFVVPADQTRRDLEDIKAIGGNFLRTTHYTPHPRVLDLCDELGLLAWVEIPAWQSKAETLASADVWSRYGEPQLREMVEQYRTHPSVVVWSVGNEFPSDKPEVVPYVARACRFVRGLDPTRLVTFASDRHDRDLSFEHVDFMAINEYFGWYERSMFEVGAMLDLLHSRWPRLPILVSEFGAGSVIGRRNPNPTDSMQDYSGDYHRKMMRVHLDQIYAAQRRPFVAGSVIWLYNDFPSQDRIYTVEPPIPNEVNNKGLVTETRVRKSVYAYVKKRFAAIR
jgi:beta-galactosidase/beta-glucuronidase